MKKCSFRTVLLLIVPLLAAFSGIQAEILISARLSPLGYVSFPYVLSADSTGIAVQPGYEIEAEASWLFPESPYAILASAGYSGIDPIMIDADLLLKGFDRIHATVGVRRRITEQLSITGLVRFNYSRYRMTHTYFAGLSVGLRPEYDFGSGDRPGTALRAAVLLPVLIDLTKQTYPTFSAGVGAALGFSLGGRR